MTKLAEVADTLPRDDRPDVDVVRASTKGGSSAFSCFVPGSPRPQGSASSVPFVHKDGPKAGRLGVRTFCADKKLPKWRADMTTLFKSTRHKYGITAPLGGPLAASYVFCLPRLKSHANGKCGPLPTAEKALDLDKLVRAANDALKDAEVIRDDSRICAIRAFKRFAGLEETPGLHVRITPISALEEAEG